MITIPGSNWQASQAGERTGNIIRSKNIELNENGKLKLARKGMSMFAYGPMASTQNGVDPSFQDNVQAILTDTTYAYLLTAGGMFVQTIQDTIESAIQIPDNSKNPTYGFDSDMVWYLARPHVSGGQYVSALNVGISTWNNRVISGLDTSVPHPLCNRERAGTLLVGNGNVLNQYSSSYVLDTANSLTIPEQYIITSIRTNGKDIYVGTRHKYGGEARMFIWNGVGVANQWDYPCGADWIYSMCVYGSATTIVTSAGVIRRFNGGGFDDLAALPVYYSSYSWTINAPLTSLVGRVANRGMAAAGNDIYLMVNGAINNSATVYPGQYIPEQPSGLWQYNPGNGLYHKGLLNLQPRLRIAPTAVNSSYVVFPTPHGVVTGDPMTLIANGITGLTTAQVYYAIVDSGAGPNTLRVALSPSDAAQGYFISIGGTPTTDAFVFDRTNLIGQSVITYPGAVFPITVARPSLFYGSEVLYGGSVYDSVNAVNAATLMSLGMGRNIGSFVTPKMLSTQIRDSFQKIASFFENLYLSTDQIIVKYRTIKRIGLPTPLFFTGSATWISATTFTVDTTKKDFKSVRVGDEVEVVSGDAAGYSAHITAIDSSSYIYIVTIDEMMPVTSGSFDFVADNWKKLTTVTLSSKEAFQGIDMTSFDTSTAKWIEMKFELRGRNIAIEQLQLINTPQSNSA